MKQQIEHNIPIAHTLFWNELFFHADYVKDEHLIGLSCLEFDVLEEYSGPPNHTRTIFSIQPLNIPTNIQKIVGSRLGYTEKGVFYPEKGEYHFTLTPNVLAQKISMKGFYRIEAVDEHTTKRICELECSVSIFGIGKKIEEVIAQSNIQIQQKTADFAAQWLAQKS